MSDRNFDVEKYVTRTPSGNIGVRDTQQNDFWYQQNLHHGQGWQNDGFSPKLARKVAAAILQLADQLEEEARKPKIENWPPVEGDVWRISSGRRDWNLYVIAGKFRTQNGVTGVIERDARGLTFDGVEEYAKDYKPTLLFRAPRKF